MRDIWSNMQRCVSRLGHRYRLPYASAQTVRPNVRLNVRPSRAPSSAPKRQADFKGDDHATYNALSARNLSLNLLFEHTNFISPHSRLHIHGSWVRAAFFTVRTSRTGRLLHVFFHSKDPHRAIINERSGCLMHPCTGNTCWRRGAVQSPYRCHY